VQKTEGCDFRHNFADFGRATGQIGPGAVWPKSGHRDGSAARPMGPNAPLREPQQPVCACASDRRCRHYVFDSNIIELFDAHGSAENLGARLTVKRRAPLFTERVWLTISYRLPCGAAGNAQRLIRAAGVFGPPDIRDRGWKLVTLSARRSALTISQRQIDRWSSWPPFPPHLPRHLGE
jgi:hypothetical protein